MKNTNQKYWSTFYYDLDYDLLDNESLGMALNLFWKKIMFPLDSSQLVSIHLKGRYLFQEDENDDLSIPIYQIISLSELQRVNKEEYHELLSALLGYLDVKYENYDQNKIKQIIISYHIFDNIDSKIQSKIIHPKNVHKLNSFKFGGYNLPNTSDYTQWGIVITNTPSFALVSKRNSKLSYQIHIHDDHNDIVIMKGIKSLIQFKDQNIKTHDTFIRTFKHQELHYINGEMKLKTLKRLTPVMNNRKIDQNINNSTIFTLDIETRVIDNTITPYCICIFDGKESHSFYLTDYRNSADMIKNALMILIKTKYHLAKIYVHNLSNFDGIFLISMLADIPNTELTPIMKDGRMYNLRFSWKGEKANKYGICRTYYIDFRDSYLMLPLSLRKLAKFFGVDSKGYFPYEFVNDPAISLQYEGIIPDLKFFKDLELNEYNQMKSKNWSLKQETIKYCIQDCQSLYQVIDILK